MQGWLSIQKPFNRFHHISRIKEKKHYYFNRFRKLIEQNSMPLHNKKNYRLMKISRLNSYPPCDEVLWWGQWAKHRFIISKTTMGIGRAHRSTEETMGYHATMADVCHYKCVQTHRMHITAVSPNVNYELGVIMMCQYTFLSSRCTAIMQVLIVERGCAFAGQGDMALALQFCCKSECSKKIES